MKRKDALNFWIGFLITAAATAWLYWLWQQRREVMPRPLIVSARKPAAALPSTGQPTPDPDDLTEIKGIGPVFVTRLNKAGIFTYAQLAAQTAEKVQFITQVTRWDPADWIAEAKKLAS
jgi:predicted flap endonuclease-1-like 5' DNA nuclease